MPIHCLQNQTTGLDWCEKWNGRRFDHGFRLIEVSSARNPRPLPQSSTLTDRTAPGTGVNGLKMRAKASNRTDNAGVKGQRAARGQGLVLSKYPQPAVLTPRLPRTGKASVGNVGLRG